MNRTSNRRHKPKISDQTLDSQDSRCEDSKECSEESSEDDDDEDENISTDRDTEESEQGSAGKGREWEALAKYLRSQRAYLERNPPDSFHRMSRARKETKDKTTQKNLTSPMPSIWKPPIYKEISATPNYKVIKSKEIKDKESEFEDVMLRYITKLHATNNAYRGEYKKSCPHKSSASDKIKKLCSKHKRQAEPKSKRGRREDIHTCMDATVSNVPQPERIRNETSAGGTKIHSRCGLPIRCYRENLKREPKNEETGKLREKLVYVVEEEGKGVAKMETDLISVNEILAIKQDLLELSEFAKKLKRLKEMKSESEKEKCFETGCQCKPLTELLRDVNKRMEALEVRQEELERGIQENREMETETKKTDDTKTSSVSPPLGPVKPEPSAVKSASTFGKSEMSREGGGAFSKNLEIVSELLDIKSQLQKLERKRMSKELSPEIGPAGFPKAKPKDQTINVFSSKTYILTSEAHKKKKNTENDQEEKSPHTIPPMKEQSTICPEGQQANNIVADWLKNITTPENPNSNLNGHMGPNTVDENEIKGEESRRKRSFFKEKNRDRILEGEEFGNQEPQKNRAKDLGWCETNQISPNCSKEIPSYLNRKEDRFVSKEFPWREKPRGRISRGDNTERYPERLLPRGPEPSFTKPRKSVSNGSIPSVVALKEQLQRMKHLAKTSNETHVVKPSRSKSAQEFTSTSNLSKDEKMVLNMSRKNLEAKLARKKEKENENEQFLEDMSTFMRLNREIFPNSSRLVATVNLEEGSMSLRNDRSRSPGFQLPLFPFPILPAEMIKILECHENDDRDARVHRGNWCRRDDWDHKPRKKEKEKDKVKACIKKCYKKKKIRVKCSRNHFHKKSKCAASRSSPSCGSCSSNKEAIKCHCRKHRRTKKTCSCESVKSVEKKREKECWKKEKICHEREKRRHEKEGKCERHCYSNGKGQPSTCETSTTEVVSSQSQEKGEPSMDKLSTDKSSEGRRRQCKEKPKKSSLRYHKYRRPEQRLPFCNDDSCYIASFWKSLRKLYPRFSALQLMSWLKLYCQEEKKTKEFEKKQKAEATEFKPPREQHKKHLSPCCKSYRMSTFHQKWPGVSPSSKITGHNITEAETRSSVTTTETDFMFPYRNPKRYYAFKAMHEENEPEESKESKKSKSRKKKNDKNKTADDEIETMERNCRCVRCGNVHSKKKKKKKEKEKEFFICDKSCCTSEVESKTKGKKSNKKGSKKSKKSIFSKLGDVRHLRVCEGKLKCPKLNFSYRKTNSKAEGSKCVCEPGSSKKSYQSKTGKNCHCESKLLELENRIHNLEQLKKNKHKHNKNKHKPEEEENEHKEKKRKKKAKKELDAECDSFEECHHEKKHKKRKHKSSKHDCYCEEKRERKKEMETEDKLENHEGKKTKKKKKHKKLDSGGEEETESYYCECMNKGFSLAKQSSEPTGTQVSTPAPSEKSSFRQNLQRKKREVLEKLSSSLTNFWKNFRKKTKSNETKTNDETFLLDDPSRSSEMPRKRSMKHVDEESSAIGKLKKKMKKQKKDKKKDKEKRVPKSQPKSKRHRLR